MNTWREREALGKQWQGLSLMIWEPLLLCVLLTLTFSVSCPTSLSLLQTCRPGC